MPVILKCSKNHPENHNLKIAILWVASAAVLLNSIEFNNIEKIKKQGYYVPQESRAGSLNRNDNADATAYAAAVANATATADGCQENQNHLGILENHRTG